MTPTLPKYYDRYIKLCNANSLAHAFEKFLPASVFDVDKLVQLGDSVYDENKWTVKQILQHCIDTERIMAYRALRFARNDATALPGFEENDYAQNANVANTGIEALLHEFSLVRQTTALFFEKLSVDELNRTGTASGIEISALYLGYVVVGHAIHHQNVIAERYYPLLK